MNIIRLLPVFISMILMSAHFMRSGSVTLLLASLLIPFILLLKRRWAARCMQVILISASLEWVRTLVTIAAMRRDAGEPWTRMAVILGCVSLFTAASSLVFMSASLRDRYGLNENREEQNLS